MNFSMQNTRSNQNIAFFFLCNYKKEKKKEYLKNIEVSLQEKIKHGLKVWKIY